MKQLHDTVWQRHGISWLWSTDALAAVSQPEEVWSLRQLVLSAHRWPKSLPSAEGSAVVVAGMDGCLDLLKPEDAQEWLGNVLKEAILSFQDEYQGEAALIFWLPGGNKRLKTNPATDDVTWRCTGSQAGKALDFGRLLWGAAAEYPREVYLAGMSEAVGLFHLRIT